MNWLIFILFFISGGCGLIYEIVWSRMLLPIFGRSALAVGTVLAAFMMGLALGSYILGKYSDRSRNPLRLYAIYEGSIALTALFASIILFRITPFYVWVHTYLGDSSVMFAVCRFLIAFIPLVVPTLLMGATLPIFSRIVITQIVRVERELGRLYAINTVGAVAGSIAAGFFLIRHFGIHGTIYCAVAGNLAVGITAYVASKRFMAPAESPLNNPSQTDSAVVSQIDPLTKQRYRLALWAFGLSGFASFAYEVFWTRSLVFLVGNTIYAFTLMLTAFLSGIALGGYGIRFIAARAKNPFYLFAVIEILIGLTSVASLPLLFIIVKSDWLNSFISNMSGQIGLLALSNFGVALLLMLIPATLIGTTFPLMGRLFLDDLKCTGTSVGKIYAVNTIGNVLGALLPGVLILPLLGIQKGILMMAALNCCIGVVIVLSWRGKRFATKLIATSLLFIFISLIIVRAPLKFQFPSQFRTANDEVLFYHEGGLVTTMVWGTADTGYKMISVDGIGIGGTSDSDYKQQILAHLPKLLLKTYDSELSVGLGSGILAGESARHSDLKKIVCVELAKGVVKGAEYFAEENYNILKDPRAVLVLDDIMDYLQTSKDKFDIISADEKTTGKFASNSMSYSKDYYSLLIKHLAPGGIVIQWMPTDLPYSQYTLAMRTFLASFPHVMLWYFPPVGRFEMSNTFLIGSNDPIKLDPAQMQENFNREPTAFQGILKYGLTSADSVLVHFIATDSILRRDFPSGPLNSFEHPYYEFYSPQDYALPSHLRAIANHDLLMSFRGKEFETVVDWSKSTDKARLEETSRAEGDFLNLYGMQLRGVPKPSLYPYYENAMEIAPWNRNMRNEIVSFLNSEARENTRSGDYTNA